MVTTALARHPASRGRMVLRNFITHGGEPAHAVGDDERWQAGRRLDATHRRLHDVRVVVDPAEDRLEIHCDEAAIERAQAREPGVPHAAVAHEAAWTQHHAAPTGRAVPSRWSAMAVAHARVERQPKIRRRGVPFDQPRAAQHAGQWRAAARRPPCHAPQQEKFDAQQQRMPQQEHGQSQRHRSRSTHGSPPRSIKATNSVARATKRTRVRPASNATQYHIQTRRNHGRCVALCYPRPHERARQPHPRAPRRRRRRASGAPGVAGPGGRRGRDPSATSTSASRCVAADLLADRRYVAATRFFLDELYGPRDFSLRDAQFARIVPALVRLFPRDIVATVEALAAAHALSERLDTAMGRELGGSVATRAGYVAAWQAAGDPPQRARQLELVVTVARALDRHAAAACCARA